jgi:WD40-like Beta Propeller Repeat
MICSPGEPGSVGEPPHPADSNGLAAPVRGIRSSIIHACGRGRNGRYGRRGPTSAARLDPWLALVVALAACGRFGYGPLPVGSDADASVGGNGASRGRDASGGAATEVGGSGNAGASGLGEGGSAGASGATLGGRGGADVGGSGGISSAGGSGGSSSGGSAPGGTGGGTTTLTSCEDGLQNGDERGVDCGAVGCLPCVCSFGAAERLGSPNRPGDQLWAPTLSSDGSTMFMGIVVAGGNEQIGVATRPDRGDTFGTASVLPAPVNQVVEGTPHVSRDGLSLYFYSARDGGSVNRELYVATRADTASPFSAVSPLASLNSSAVDHLPWVSTDELIIYFASARGGDSDVWSATRASRAQAFGAPAPVSELNSTANDNRVALTEDELVVILSSDRSGVGWDLYQSVRARRDEPFSAPEPIAALNTPHMEADPALTLDGRELFFTSTSSGETEIWRAQRTCP